MAKLNKVEYRSPKQLMNHPANTRIYDSTPQQSFVESVKDHGVREPLRILPNNTIISGHKRRQAANILGMDEVPVIVETDIDPNDDVLVRLALLVSNDGREKSIIEKGREFDERVGIEQELAARRKEGSQFKKEIKAEENGKPHKKPPKPEKQGEAAAIAAESVGMSKQTALRASDVVKEIDRLTKAGEVEAAGEIKELLEKSVSGAYKKVKETQVSLSETPFDKAIQLCDMAISRYLPRLQDDALIVEQALGTKGTVTAEKLVHPCRLVFKFYDEAKDALVALRNKYRKKMAKPS